MASVLRAVLLDRIIGQVDEIIVEVLRVHRVGLARRPQVALTEEVHVHIQCQGHPDSDVELALVYEKRPLNVLLNDEGLRFDRWLRVGECRCNRLLIGFWLHDHCGGGFRVHGQSRILFPLFLPFLF